MESTLFSMQHARREAPCSRMRWAVKWMQEAIRYTSGTKVHAGQGSGPSPSHLSGLHTKSFLKLHFLNVAAHLNPLFLPHSV